MNLLVAVIYESVRSNKTVGVKELVHSYAAAITADQRGSLPVGVVLPWAAFIPADPVKLFLQAHLLSKAMYLRQLFPTGLPAFTKAEVPAG